MKVLVTGGAGMIGSHVVDRLTARGDEVLIVDNLVTGCRDNVPITPLVRFVEGRIESEEMLDVVGDFGPEIVLHCAASYKDAAGWENDVTTNVLGTINVLRASQHAGVRRLIYLQTALCYGLTPAPQPVPVTHPLVPQGSSYACSKTVAEQYIQLSGIEHVTFRLANMYGPRTLTGPMPAFYDRLVRGQRCFVADSRRDFVFVGDLAGLILRAIDGLGRPGAYNVASGHDCAIRDLYDAIRAAMGLPPDPGVEIKPRLPEDAYRLLLDPSETQREFGWTATTSLGDGTRQLVEWYRSNPPARLYTHLALR